MVGCNAPPQPRLRAIPRGEVYPMLACWPKAAGSLGRASFLAPSGPALREIRRSSGAAARKETSREVLLYHYIFILLLDYGAAGDSAFERRCSEEGDVARGTTIPLYYYTTARLQRCGEFGGRAALPRGRRCRARCFHTTILLTYPTTIRLLSCGEERDVAGGAAQFSSRSCRV